MTRQPLRCPYCMNVVADTVAPPDFAYVESLMVLHLSSCEPARKDILPTSVRNFAEAIIDDYLERNRTDD